ncbi:MULTISPECIES: hypothetical protein [unclassified Corynebacterium]|uniref:hypothetical protein n=1 Tax=unclassified Corynebacterium TaxID=2624378 RepID=UPI0029C9DD60|nr:MULTISPECIES: hypothetical protein [unclassified Corynebacterium]WPF65872.1 hypothetical protein OLX12_09995 [Corynebacterium sp. 22KM0430]WPF68365.1 hypothetical protein OLW90_09990 [Corynebacterium sp. 21KM1197]
MFSSPYLRAALAWWGSRALLLLYAVHQPVPRGDVAYYFRGLEAEARGERAMSEYPDASIAPLRLLYHLVGGEQQSFVIALLLLMLSLDGLFCYALARRRAWWALGFWLLFALALAPLFTRRLDLLPGLTVAAAALFLARSPRCASALLALATALKLWPVALASGLVGHWRSAGTWVRLAWFGGALVLLTAASTLTQGWWRVLSPLTYQDERGLQSEAITATPFLWLRLTDSERWSIDYAPSQSYEVFGPGISWGLHAATALTAAAALIIIGITAWRFLRQAEYRPEATRALWLLTVMLILMTAKVFSPQYLLWVAPLLAVILALDSDSGAIPRPLRWCAATLLGAAVLTCLVYPVFFDQFLATPAHGGVVFIATLRNILIVAATACAAAWCLRILRRERR